MTAKAAAVCEHRVPVTAYCKKCAVGTEVATRRSAELEPLAAARALIAKAVEERDVAGLNDMRARASAVELYQERSGARDLANDAGEIKVRAERGLGQIDLDENPRGRPSAGKDGGDPIFSVVESHTRALWRKLAKLTDEQLAALVASARSDEHRSVSTSGIFGDLKSGGRRDRDAEIRRKREAAEAAARATIERLGPDACRIQPADIRTWRPEGVDCIVTDPPYITDDAVELHGLLADFAVDVLPDHGALAVMTWQPLLPAVLKVMERPELVYRWTAAWVFETSARTPERKPRVFDGWKPILVFHKNGWTNDATYLYDVVKSPDADKGSHEWGQNIDGFRQLVRAFSQPGETVCDPFVGGGTTSIAALAEARLFVGADIDEAATDVAKERLAA